MSKLLESTSWILIGGAIAIAIALIWYFMQDDSNSDSSPGGIGSAITGAIQNAVQTVATGVQTAGAAATGSGSDLQNEDNGIIFGGGA
jgi:hypothetical protein